MRSVLLLLSITVLFGDVPASARADADHLREGNPDEQKLRAAGLPTDGPGLVAFFRQRAGLVADVAALTAQTERLADADPRVRAQAAAALVGRGATALPVLRQTINELGDPEVTARARRCLQLIEGEAAAELPAAAARLLPVRRPAAAVEALLAYLPVADNDRVIEEVAAALTALAYADGKPHPALFKALQDKAPLRRAVAGAALCRKDRPGLNAGVRQLLTDAKPLVRLRVARALAEADDLEAVPVLIDLLAEVPAASCQQAEEVLQRLAGDWAPTPPLKGDDEVAQRIRRDAWAAWWRHTEPPILVAAFRRRTLPPGDFARVATLIEKLGDRDFSVREGAVVELTALGDRAVPLLREATHGTDPERVLRAEDCLRLVARARKPIASGAARLLALRQPTGAAAVLLDYLPFAGDEGLVAEVQVAVASLAVRDGQLDPALPRALEDRFPERRAAAAEAIVKGGVAEQRAPVRKLLRDADPVVRIRVALALALAGDKAAVPVLIDSLAEEPSDGNGQAQDLLYRLADDRPPKVEPASDTAGRRKQRDAWVAWWKEAASTTDLSVLRGAPPLLGYTLVVEVQGNAGRVMELGRDGKPLWTIGDLLFPVDAHVLAGNRVLIAEFRGQRVTERDFTGKILWQKEGLGSNPVNVQRLANDNTFIATNTELLEVDRSGKTVWSQPQPNTFAAYKSRHGVITCLTGNRCVRLSAEGKELKSFPLGFNNAVTSGIDVLPNGRVLLADNNTGAVSEVDGEGKVFWQARTPGVASATRLPNGHTLLASYDNHNVTEVTRAGEVVWEHKAEGFLFRGRRR